jgi:hypothetical protein
LGKRGTYSEHDQVFDKEVLNGVRDGGFGPYILEAARVLVGNKIKSSEQIKC